MNLFSHPMLRPVPRTMPRGEPFPPARPSRPASAAPIRTIAMVGNHTPRQCGIATFTADLGDAISVEFPEIDCCALAINEPGARHEYPPRVRFEIAESELASFRRAGDFLNLSSIDALSLQHEYGIFGGSAGSHVLELLRGLRMPIVTTLHTLLAAPDPAQRRAMDEVIRLSERLVVMSAHGAQLLRQVHGVNPDKIDLIPHGIPDVPFAGQSKERLGLAGKSVILTFGLLSPDKGIEHVIDALPAILELHPNAVYIVVGATHPNVKQHHGEEYRLMLEARARSLGVGASTIFHNRFVSPAELTEFLSATDIYITPYLKPEQITSGTLAYAVGSGRAVISTPYSYASELLADGRGILVPWKDPHAIAREVAGLLEDDEKRLALRLRAATYGRAMRWPAVARAYLESFERARLDHAARQPVAPRAKPDADGSLALPPLKLDHLRLLTDDTGILQHAAFLCPRYEDGYCLDDNARALLLATLLAEAGALEGDGARSLSSRYLAFVSHAFDRDRRRFRNQMSYSRQFTEEVGSEDSHGRALWALGVVVGRALDPGRPSLASELFHGALDGVGALSSPRAWAFALLGLEEYLFAFGGDRGVEAVSNTLARRLLHLFREVSSPEWPWFEDRLTYENARLSQALLVSGRRMRDQEMIAAARRSLEWLVSIQTADDCFAPIGSNGFYPRGGTRAEFDQQPVEACATIAACLEARRCFGDVHWWDDASRAFAWFHGRNASRQSLYDPMTGGCRDGLHVDRVNENQGAESTLSFLLALNDMRVAALSGLDACEDRTARAFPVVHQVGL